MKTSDARLIAAAPTLLAYAEAEQELADHLVSCEDCDPRRGDDSLCQLYWDISKKLGPIGELRKAAIKLAKGEGL